MAVMKVLVPLDGSRLSDAVLAHVRRLLHRDARGWEVHLLHAVDEEGERPEARAEARNHLYGMERLLEAEGLRTTTRVVADDPVHAILEHVVEERIDLVAMATHGRTGIGRWVRGSVAERVLRGCPAPLLLVNPKGLLLTSDDVRYHRILVPVDATTDVDAGLTSVAALAAASGASVLLLQLEAGEERARRARARLEQQAVSVTAIAGRGDRADAVLAAAREHAPDLIALSTAPRSWLTPWPLEDTVARVTRAAPCPVLLLRSAAPIAT